MATEAKPILYVLPLARGSSTSTHTGSCPHCFSSDTGGPNWGIEPFDYYSEVKGFRHLSKYQAEWKAAIAPFWYSCPKL